MSDKTLYYVVNERAAVVRKGPFDDREEARAEADGPNDVVATGDVLEMVERGKQLRWINDDGPDVIGAGGGGPR